ncbi:hypothetical protein Ga0074812_15211 [Parafrankia irregularis]|uniref:Phosphotransferase enzyme family protein n=1 Tax=Parafrankia irregularis TaxID=795642 RepID=A0A0S4R2K8_9ACTN|nr:MULTISPECIES: hypothetical protein [Parafrankia]MBE3206712.1 hypothetical protein [Parafrankia sp. CH37]CUU60986.1 hypothetical protein Ga0074812_15211 [Parafrankia irregularis]
MTAVAAGPLAGAAHPRPRHWLARPLATDRDTVTAQARRLLDTHHSGTAGPVRCLTARERSATFTVGDPPQAILKWHADEAAYLGERLAYDLLATDRLLPRLRGSSDEARTLLVDYLPAPADLTNLDIFDDLISLVVRVHTASARWEPAMHAAMAQWRVDTLLAEDPPWVDDPPAWRRTLNLIAAAHGPTHVPVGNLDLATDHVRRQPDGQLALVDVETLRPDVTGVPDVVTLAYLAAHAHHTRPGPWVRARYLHHAARAGATWTDRNLLAALTGFAAATGLTSLHGLDD